MEKAAKEAAKGGFLEVQKGPVDGRNSAPPEMYKNPIDVGESTLSIGARVLSTVKFHSPNMS